MRGSLRIGRLAGIPIGIHPLWLVIVGLITLSLGHDYFPQEAPGLSDTAAYALGLAGALGLFGGILLHELGHAVVARRHGVEVEEIDLWLLGGVARLRGEAKRPDDELKFAAAGPAVTAVIALVLAAVHWTIGSEMAAWARALLDYELYVNAAILVLNLLPAFPLDGGRIFRSLLWRRWDDHDRATLAAARGGRAFGWGLVALGGLAFLEGAVGGLWFALIGWFLIVASAAESQSTEVAHALAGVSVSQLMSSPAVSLPEDLALDDAIRVGFSRHLYSAFPVTDRAGCSVGLITIGDVRARDSRDRSGMLVGDIAHRDPELFVEPSLPATELMARPAFQRLGRAVVVDDLRRVVGLVSITDVQRRLRADALLPGLEPLRRAA